MRLSDVFLIAGAAARLTRFVTTDSLGYWTLVRPAQRWAKRREKFARRLGRVDPSEIDAADLDPDDGPRSKLVSGLDCPYCVGFWIGAAVIASYHVASRHSATLTAWRAVTGALALNYATAHVGSRLD